MFEKIDVYNRCVHIHIYIYIHVYIPKWRYPQIIYFVVLLGFPIINHPFWDTPF